MEKSATLKVVSIQNSERALDDFPAESGSKTESTSPPKSGPKRFGSTAVITGAVVSIAVGVVAGLFWVNARTSAATPATGAVTVESEPAGADIFIDGRALGKTPSTLSLVEGKHQLTVQLGARTQQLPLTIAGNTRMVHHITWPDDAASVNASLATGSIRITSEPSTGTVLVDAIDRGTTPLTVSGLSVGRHDVVVRMGSVIQRRTLQVDANTTTALVITGVDAGVASGWLAATAAAPLRISEQGKLIGTTESERIMLPAGDHTFEFSSDPLGFTATRTVKVSAGQTASLAVQLPRVPVSLNAVPWAEVWVDGQALGATPIGNFSTTIGTHEVIFRHPQFGERRLNAVVTLKQPARIAIDMTK